MRKHGLLLACALAAACGKRPAAKTCKTAADCPATAVCRQGLCSTVACLLTPCDAKHWCDTSDGVCKAGCDGDAKCPATYVCDLASHGCTCPAQTHVCSGACVSDGDPQACGTSCTPCQPPLNAQATCSSGTCGYRCDPGYFHCAGGCCGAVGIAAGQAHTCAVLDDATVRCWGANAHGQLGDGTTTPHPNPVAVPLPGKIQVISAGGDVSAAIDSAGYVSVWGSNYDGQLCDPTLHDALTPVQSGPVGGPDGVAPAPTHACYWGSSAGPVVHLTISCCGKNDRGQLGDGTTTDSSTGTSPTNFTPMLAVSGTAFSCATNTSNALYCWGAGDAGQLGDGSTADSDAPQPVNGLTEPISIVAAGARHACAVDGYQLKCWGDNTAGQLGIGNQTSHDTPQPVATLTDTPIAVCAGSAHTCTLHQDGNVYCWGDGSHGQLGGGTTSGVLAPVQVKPSLHATQLACGANHTCVVTSSGTVVCWGANADGQVGNGATADALSPVYVSSP